VAQLGANLELDHQEISVGTLTPYGSVRKDLRGGRVLVARRGTEGRKLEEVLPTSRRSWMVLGSPAEWRMRK
jgi:hypothetical protein